MAPMRRLHATPAHRQKSLARRYAMDVISGGSAASLARSARTVNRENSRTRVASSRAHNARRGGTVGMHCKATRSRSVNRARLENLGRRFQNYREDTMKATHAPFVPSAGTTRTSTRLVARIAPEVRMVASKASRKFPATMVVVKIAKLAFIKPYRA
jgi:hypothetical protein